MYNYKKFDKEMDFSVYETYGLPLDKYCLKQCLKICYYLQKVFLYEIIKMDCAFFKGETEVALYFISDLHVRETKGVRTRPFWMKEELEQPDSVNHLQSHRSGKLRT